MKKQERMTVSHTFGAFRRPDSEYLILGSFPSVKSREMNFYYGHPQNRFWRILAAVFHDTVPSAADTDEKKVFLIRNRIALYDVIDSCSIIGSSDSSIRDVVPTELSPILEGSRIGNRIFVNGGTAYRLYMKYLLPETGIEPVKLPSSSAANAAWRLDALVSAWGDALSGSRSSL